MRILYLTHEYLDYLSDEVLYGLRFLLGESVVDYPKKEILYQHSKGKVPVTMVWGNGATAFGLPDISVDRNDIKKKSTRDILTLSSIQIAGGFTLQYTRIWSSWMDRITIF